MKSQPLTSSVLIANAMIGARTAASDARHVRIVDRAKGSVSEARAHHRLRLHAPSKLPNAQRLFARCRRVLRLRVTGAVKCVAGRAQICATTDRIDAQNAVPIGVRTEVLSGASSGV